MFIKWFFFVDLADINVTCDILIIGAGSSGAQCAHFLCDQGLSVVVVDKRKVGEGSTSTNTALIQYTGEESFISLKNTFGEEAAARQLKLCEQSINHIEPFSKSEGVRIYGVLAKIVTHKIMHGSSPDSDLYLQNRPLVEKKHSNSFHVPWKRAVRQNNVRTLLNFRFLLMVYYNAKSRFHIYFWNRLLTMISQNILLPSIVTG